jgi:hypothetical protein
MNVIESVRAMPVIGMFRGNVVAWGNSESSRKSSVLFDSIAWLTGGSTQGHELFGAPSL